MEAGPEEASLRSVGSEADGNGECVGGTLRAPRGKGLLGGLWGSEGYTALT